jgi:Dolichyl-phosphate-mannose-protein mannosyltransferase
MKLVHMAKLMNSAEVGHPRAVVPVSACIGRTLPVAVGLVAIATAIYLGVFARFTGLNLLQLAVDEYYFVQGVRLILEHGVPRFPTGGFYDHGTLAQYSIAGSVLLFGENGFGYRVPMVLFSLGSVFLLYVYSRRFLERIPAGVICAMLLVSSWHIEFARFARMYSELQFLTLLFFIILDKAFYAEQWRWRYIPHLILIVGTLIHDVAILLGPFLVLPLLMAKVRERFTSRASLYRYLGITILTIFGSLFLARFDFRSLGISSPFPEGYTPPVFSPLRLPEFPFWSVTQEPLWNLVFFVAVLALVGGALAVWRHYDKRVRETDILLALLLMSAVFHMFVLSAGLFVLLFFRYRLYRVSEHPARSYVLFSLAVIGALIWIAYALLSYHSLASLTAAERVPVKVLARAFFGWPDFYGPVLVPWLKELPLLAVIVASAFAYQIISRARDPLASVVRHPAFIVAYMVVCFGIFSSLYASTRYFFFVYPLILLFVALTVAEIFERFMRRLPHYDKTTTQTLALLACVALFVSAEDFHLRHITDISSQEVRFRLGEFKRYSATWYGRSDFESPATFVHRLTNPDAATRVIVVGLPVVSYYLNRPHAMYYDRRGVRFYNVSRVGGTVDLWSNQRLLSTEDELRSYTQSSKRAFIIQSASAERRPFEIEEVWKGRLASADRVFESLDGRIEVIRVDLLPGRLGVGRDDPRDKHAAGQNQRHYPQLSPR